MSSDKRNGISVVIPAYNEGQAIGETLVALTRTLDSLKRPTEIIVVDDGSSDNTAALAETAGVKVLRHPANSGYGRSLLSGIEAAAHDTIAIVDADGTYPTDRLPDLLETFDKGFDMVVGARQGEYYYTSFGKRILRFIFRLLAEYSSGQSIPDINSGFRVFTRKPVLERRSSLSTGFSFTTTITLLFMLNNLLVSYVPVEYNKRVGKSKVRLVQDGLRSLQIIFTAIAQFNPLKLYLLLLIANVAGTILVLVGLLLQTSWLEPMIAWVLIISWNTLCIIMAIAILTVATIKPVPARID